MELTGKKPDPSPMHAILPRLAALLLAAASSAVAASPLPRSTPEAEGVSSAGIREFLEAADRGVDTMHSFMLVRHGRVVAEGWWRPESAEKPHVLYSLSKSFTSTAVGLAVAEGKLSIDDPVLKFFPGDAPATPSDKLKAMRVRDLLTMSTGHQTEPKLTPDDPWVRSFLAQPVEHKPGAHFLYNSAGTYMCSAIVQKLTGQTVLDYLRPRLFEPLGIEGAEWSASPQGISAGGVGAVFENGGHREIRPALFAKGPVERKAARARGVGRAGHRAASFQWQRPGEGLGSRLRLSILALPPRRVSRRRRVRAILPRAAGAVRSVTLMSQLRIGEVIFGDNNMDEAGVRSSLRALQHQHDVDHRRHVDFDHRVVFAAA